MGWDKVKIDQDFYLGKYLVTQQQWEAAMGYNPSYYNGGSLPEETVSHDDVQIFIKKLNALSGKQNYRLPTETELEYAFRAGSTSAYYFGDDVRQLGEYSWYVSNSGLTTHPVGQKKPTEWGLYDMAGNVWEWTDIWYDSSCSGRVCFVAWAGTSMQLTVGRIFVTTSPPATGMMSLASAWSLSRSQLAAHASFAAISDFFHTGPP